MQSGIHGPVSRLVAAAVGGVLAGSSLVVPAVAAAAKPPAPLSAQVEALGTAGGGVHGVRVDDGARVGGAIDGQVEG